MIKMVFNYPFVTGIQETNKNNEKNDQASNKGQLKYFRQLKLPLSFSS